MVTGPSRVGVPPRPSATAGRSSGLRAGSVDSQIRQKLRVPGGGRALFVPMEDALCAIGSHGTRFAQRLIYLDTPPPEIARPFDALVRVADHHGTRATLKKNTTGQLVEMFQETRRHVGLPDAKVSPKNLKVKRAMAELNLSFCTTDNLADGTDAVLMLQNQALFLADPELLEQYDRAMHFVDFEAFSPAYAGKAFKELPPHVVWALAIYQVHDSAIANKELKFAGADRFAPENAQPIIDYELPLLLEVLQNPSSRTQRAREMWQKITTGAAQAKKDAVIDQIMADGDPVGYFYQNSVLANLGYFAAQLSFARAYPNAVFYVKVIDLPAPNIIRDETGQEIARQRLLICALPYGRSFPNGQFIPGDFAQALLAADRKVVAALMSQANSDTSSLVKSVASWLVRAEVVVTGGGTLLSPRDVKALVEQELPYLFQRRG